MSASRACPPSPALAQALETLAQTGALEPLKVLAAPWLVDQAAATRMAEVGQVVLTALKQLLREWAANAPGLPVVTPPPLVAEAARRDIAADRLLTFTRLDVVCPPDEPQAFRLLEVQAGDPSAMGWNDLLSEAFAPHVPGGATPMLMRPSHRAAFEALTAGRRIAFAVQRGSLVERDHAALAVHYAANGWDARVVDPSELRFDGAVLTAAGRPVDAVFRDAIDELPGEALYAAHRAGAAVVLNPFAAAVADDKSWLEPLSTPARWDGDTAFLLRNHVPCTRVLADRRTTFEGREVDLVPYARREQNALVLKPVDGFGGFGVVVGEHATPADWELALEGALEGPRRFVVQRALKLPRQQVTLRDGSTAERYVVHSLWFHGHRFAGAFVRVSTRPVVNVHQGGGLTPVFFVPAFG